MITSKTQGFSPYSLTDLSIRLSSADEDELPLLQKRRWVAVPRSGGAKLSGGFQDESLPCALRKKDTKLPTEQLSLKKFDPWKYHEESSKNCKLIPFQER